MDKKEWNNFIIENNGLFLQSWEWGEFQKSLGRKIWRLEDGENWQALIIKYDLPMGKNYLYCPGGPVAKVNSKKEQVRLGRQEISKILEVFLDKIKNIITQEKSVFLKVESFWALQQIQEKKELLPERIRQLAEKSKADQTETLRQAQGINLESIGFKKSDGGQRILKTLVLDLTKSEEQLLTGMKQKTRYNIKLAEKHGVRVRISENPEKDVEYYLQLAEQTSERDKFGIHLGGYYREQLKIKSENFQVKLFIAEYDNKIIAANIVVFWNSRAVYLHGASSNEARNVMAPYLLQWEQIKEAKKQGCGIYDFWGIHESKWPGVTRFKKGFGGEKIDYVGVYDYVFDKLWYLGYKIAKKFL